jgi:arylsulfatase A-like enzyme
VGLIEYKPGAAFLGVIGRTTDQSSPAWPQPVRTAAGAPNVMIIVLDDTGYGQLGCYGSPIATPNFDALAAGGLLYTNMHTTALCSPSRSCIMTGRNHHANATAGVNEEATGYPGYNGRIPFENGFLSEMLLAHGYSTYLIGKYHLLPSEFEFAVGPFDRWPLGRGFERFYGFLGGDTSQWYPDLVYDNHQVEPPATPEQGYHLNADLADRAIQFLADAAQVAPDKPFYLHYCPGATHAPHHVPKEWADRYARQFDDGRDAYRERVFARQKELGIMPADAELSRHDPDVPAWESLPADARRLAARMMEVFAGFLSHTDHHLGRVIDFLKETGQFDNTLIMLVSGNGASAEGGVQGTTNELQFFNNAPETLEESLRSIDELGGPDTFNHYPWGWTWAGNTPFRRWKRETYRGGTADPFVVHWPAGIPARGAVRTQYAHIIDIVPTVLDVLGADPPETIRGVTQSPLHGVSFAHTFADADAPGRRGTQYFEMLGHRAIDHHGWRAVCPWPGPSFAEAGQGFGVPDHRGRPHRAGRAPVGAVPPRRGPDREPQPGGPAPRPAHRDDRPVVRRGGQVQRAADRRQHGGPADGGTAPGGGATRPVRVPAGTQTVPAWVSPRLLNRPHSITADVEIPAAEAGGSDGAGGAGGAGGVGSADDAVWDWWF